MKRYAIIRVVRAAPLELKVEATRREQSKELLGGGGFEDMASLSSEMFLVDEKMHDETMKEEEMKDSLLLYLVSIVGRR